MNQISNIRRSLSKLLLWTDFIIQIPCRSFLCPCFRGVLCPMTGQTLLLKGFIHSQFMGDKCQELTEAYSTEVWKGELNSRCKKQTKHLEVCPPLCRRRCFSILSFKQVRFYESLLAPQGNAIVPSSSLGRLCSYTGKIHFNIYLHEYFSPFWKEKKSRSQNGFGGCAAGCSADGRSSEREIVHSGKKNHCVTPGEKYCCFA